jgi:hypothetical protein
MLGGRARRALECWPNRETQELADAARQQLGLVEATLTSTLGVNRYGHERITADRHPAPAFCHQLCKRRHETQLAVVFERMDGGARGTVERGARLKLHDACRLRRLKADGHAGRLVPTPGEVRAAGWAQGCTFDSAAWTRGWQQYVE